MPEPLHLALLAIALVAGALGWCLRDWWLERAWQRLKDLTVEEWL